MPDIRPFRRLLSAVVVTSSVAVSTVLAIAITRLARSAKDRVPDADDPIVCPPVDCYLADLMVTTR